MRNVAFTKDAFREYNGWFTADIKLVARIQELIRDIDRDPFKGIGKPELLKVNGQDIGAAISTRNIAWFTKSQKYKY